MGRWTARRTNILEENLTRLSCDETCFIKSTIFITNKNNQFWNAFPNTQFFVVDGTVEVEKHIFWGKQDCWIRAWNVKMVGLFDLYPWSCNLFFLPKLCIDIIEFQESSKLMWKRPQEKICYSECSLDLSHF